MKPRCKLKYLYFVERSNFIALPTSSARAVPVAQHFKAFDPLLEADTTPEQTRIARRMSDCEAEAHDFLE
jgi:hypothetical protein